jgi:gas vesicle protein
MTSDENKIPTGEDFFAPERMFVILFGQDGQGGTLGELREELRSHREQMEELKHQMEVISPNGMRGELDELWGKFKEHVQFCQSVQVNKETAEAVAEAYKKGLRKAEQQGEENAERRFKRAMILWGKILATIAGTTALITWFLSLLGAWN